MHGKLEALAQDLRYALRMLRRTPGFTTAAILSLALGIGANTAVFSLIDAVLLRHLPVRAPSELVAIGNQDRVNGLSSGNERTDLYSVPLFRELQRSNSVFTGMYANGRTDQVVEGPADSGRHPSTRLVSGAYFDVLGVSPLIGRTFDEAEADAPGRSPMVVISYEYWRKRFNGNPTALGRKLVLNGYPFTVIGVTPRQFYGDIVGVASDIWVPLGMQEQLMPGRKYLDDRSVCWLLLMGRMKPGISFEQARAQVTTLVRQIVIAHEGSSIDADRLRFIRKSPVPVERGDVGLSRLRLQFSGSLLTLMALVGVVLLIACGNLANLLLARATARRREIAVRLAIGAERGRILRQLITESLLLAAFGGAIGLMVAFWASRGLLLLASPGDAIPLQISPDPRIFLFALGVSFITGVLFGVAPALRAARVEVAPTLRETARALAGSSSRLSAGRILVVVQVALSALLVFGAGLFVRTLRNLEQEDTGFARSRILMMELDPIASGYKPAAIPSMCLELMDRLRQLPGVDSATFSENGIFSGTESGESVQIPGYTPKSDIDRDVANDRVGPDYFQTVGGRILLGRDMDRRDGPGAPKVAIINEAMAQHYFPGQNPVGRHFVMDNHTTNLEIVGVAANIRDHSLRDEVRPRFYFSYLQPVDNLGGFNFEIRTSGDPALTMSAVRDAVRQFDRGLRIFSMAPVEEQIGDRLEQEKLVARMSSLFGMIALLLAIFGLYGVLSYNVARRTSEIGVRMALGASSGGVLRMVLAEAIGMTVAGLVIAIPMSIMAARLVSSRLFGLQSSDPATMAGAAALMLAAAVFAAWLPARRAAGTDPMTALRWE